MWQRADETSPIPAGRAGGLFVVAIDFAPGAGETLAAPLAEALGNSLYEARARLSGAEGGPAVVASYGEIEPAWACAGRLRANGFSPLLVTPDDVESDASRFLVRSFTLGGQSLAVESRRGQTAEVPYAEVDLMLRGVRIDERTETKTTEERKFSPGRALLSGGLLLSKTTRKTEQIAIMERYDFLHLYSAGRPPLVFRSNSLNYQSLGSALQPSTAANFAVLAERLRPTLSPRARYDDRLTNRAVRARILGPSLTENHLDFAISLLARVLR